MKKVTRYKADDGRLFDSEEKALAHDSLTRRIDEAQNSLLPVEIDSNGDEYFQATQGAVDNFKLLLRQLLKEEDPEYVIMFDHNPKGIIGRYLCDGDSILNGLYDLFLRTDCSNRVWGQIYFANNPNPSAKSVLK